ncbi:MAG: D-aminoacylase [Acidobacteria bacterium]|nr:D-aminoacylase [Acidobacteriota bacterium]
MTRHMTAAQAFFCGGIATVAVLAVQLTAQTPAGHAAPAPVHGAAAAAQAAQAPATYDLVIRNGRVLDGDGNPWFHADIGVRGDRIVAVGDLRDARATRDIDATGLYVAPGFIDTHTHTGPGLATEKLGAAEPQLAEGITTVFVNPDGEGQLDLAAQRAAFMKAGIAVNVAQFVPHGPVREAVLGKEDRHPTAAELDRMRALVRTGMQEGAWGLSSGPFYFPQSFADTQEFVEMARVAAAFGGAYQSHIRDESDYNVGVIAAVEEVITVAREAKLPAIVTHIKALGPGVWGFATAMALRIERARAEGLEVWADQYPYTAGATSLAAALLPRWAQAGGDAALQQRLADPATRAKIRGEMAENLVRRGGAASIQFRRVVQDPSIEGRTLDAVARARTVDPLDVALAIFEKGNASVVSFAMIEDDVRTFLRKPWVMTASDGDLVPFDQGVPHPRSYGTFPRKLQRYVVDEPVITLDQAIRSMTSLPARVFRMPDRGELRPGAIADIVVFDLARVRERATYTEPHQLSEGMVHVFVNGRAAISDGKVTGDRAGRVLRRDGR